MHVVTIPVVFIQCLVDRGTHPLPYVPFLLMVALELPHYCDVYPFLLEMLLAGCFSLSFRNDQMLLLDVYEGSNLHCHLYSAFVGAGHVCLWQVKMIDASLQANDQILIQID